MNTLARNAQEALGGVYMAVELLSGEECSLGFLSTGTLTSKANTNVRARGFKQVRKVSFQ